MRPETERTITELGAGRFDRKYIKMLEEAEASFAEDEHAVFTTKTNVTAFTLGTKKQDTYIHAMVCFTNKRLIVGEKSALTSGLFNIDLKDVKAVASHEGRSRARYIDINTDTMRYEIFASHNKEECEKAQSIIADTVKECQTADSTSAGTASNEDVFTQIEKLGELRDKGLLTDEEFDTKKSELLSRL